MLVKIGKKLRMQCLLNKFKLNLITPLKIDQLNQLILSTKFFNFFFFFEIIYLLKKKKLILRKPTNRLGKEGPE